MGKRRDRRHAAALGGGGRRVKLDLWMEEDDTSAAKPQESARAISMHAEAGDNESAGHSSAPSLSVMVSAGAFQENPLSLLGQYSDDEMEEEEPDKIESEGNVNITSQKDISGHVETQVATFTVDLEDGGLSKEEDAVSGRAALDSELLCNADFENNERKSATEPQAHETEKGDDCFVGEPSHTACHDLPPQRGEGKLELEWKAVLHEESGEYYYWNTQTGETTWEVPTVLRQDEYDLTTDSGICKAPDKEPLIILERDRECLQKEELVSEYEPENTAGFLRGNVHADLVSKMQSDLIVKKSESPVVLSENADSDETHELGTVSSEPIAGKEMGVSGNIIETDIVSSGEDITIPDEDSRLECVTGTEPNSPSALKASTPAEALPEIERSPSAENMNSESHHLSVGIDEHDVTLNNRKKDETGWLLQWADHLSSQLKHLTKGALLTLPLSVRLAVELEVRVNDCKALASQGCLEGAFFSHAETQLRRIESELADEEAAMSGETKQHQQSFTAAVRKFQEFGGVESHDQEPHHLPVLGSKGVEPAVLESDTNLYQAAVTLPSSIGVKPDSACVEGEIHPDIDMEVDMDVDDMAETHLEPSFISGKQEMTATDEYPHTALVYKMPHEAHYPALTCMDYPSSGLSSPLPPGTSISDMWPPPPPPPPDDEWAPLPPEPELPPPPPSEEPPPLPPTSPHDVGPGLPAQSVPSLSYEGLAVAYPSIPHSYYYYESFSLQPTNDVTPEIPPYSESTIEAGEYFSSWPDQHQSIAIQPDSSAVAVNSVTHVLDYVPTLSAVDYIPPMPLAISPIPVGSPNTVPFMPFSSAPVVALDVESTVHMTHVSSGAVQATSKEELDIGKPVKPSTVSPVAVTTMPAVVASSAASAAVPVELMPAANTKKPTKVTRPKKRTHTVAVSAPLISNKKVSTLVHKWMAAKEELHGNVEEEEDKALYDLEALERKRQKEIEEWRREQLASGEALENANFQPLGTLDWRERVKRAKKIESAEDNPTHGSPKSTEMHPTEGRLKKKPDLEELSRNLPPGWQAFWDETSEDVYYGNLETSETTWERPVVNPS